MLESSVTYCGNKSGFECTSWRQKPPAGQPSALDSLRNLRICHRNHKSEPKDCASRAPASFRQLCSANLPQWRIFPAGAHTRCSPESKLIWFLAGGRHMFHWNTSMNSLLSFIMRSPFADHRNPSWKATKAIQSRPRVVSCLRFPTFWVVFIIQPTRKEFSIAGSRLLRDPETNKVELDNRFIITMMLRFSFIVIGCLPARQSRSGDWVTKAIISSSSLLNQHYYYRSVYVDAVNVISVVVSARLPRATFYHS